jgi:hypothetical protein
MSFGQQFMLVLVLALLAVALLWYVYPGAFEDMWFSLQRALGS